MTSSGKTTAAMEAATMKSMKKSMMFFGGHGNGFPKPLRRVAAVTAATIAWLAVPVNAFVEKPIPIKPYSRLTEKGLTQTLDTAMRAKVTAKETDSTQTSVTTPEVRRLSDGEMQALRGKGPVRRAYFSGSLPWRRSLHDVDMTTGNLFKSFTDIQTASGRGAGLILQRTYNSNDERIGPFGVGWTHTYDIRMEEAGPDPDVDAEIVPRTDFFGGKHKYRRDADGLYSPPAYLYDETDSKYDDALANGPSEPIEDTQRGMNGTIKHFITNETLPDSSINHDVRVCDYIEDRHGNRTNLAYDQTITMPDGSTKKLLTSVTDTVGRSLTFTWSNLGTSSQPAYRIVQIQGPSGTYRVTYAYNSEHNLSSVSLDPDNMNRTTTYGYTSYSGEDGLLASITDPLNHTVAYQYGPLYTFNPSGYPNPIADTMAVTQVSEPATENGVATTSYWNIGICVFQGGYTNSWATFNLPLFDSKTFIHVYADEQLRVNGVSTLSPSGVPPWGASYPTYQIEYDTSNNVTKTTTCVNNPAGEAQTTGYSFIQSNMTYGPHGNVLTRNLSGFPGTTTTHYYNASKYFQKSSVTDAQGNVTNFDYYEASDPNVGNRGEVKWVRDARYNTTGKQFEYTYNQYGQKIAEKNLNDIVTSYAYGDSWGDLTQMVQDPSDPLVGHVGLARTTTLVYDVNGRIQTTTDPLGHTSQFSYNTLGQPAIASFPATANTPSETITYGYGANGRTESVTDGRGTTSMAYETGCDRVASVTDPVSGTVSYTYGVQGQRKTVSFPGGATWTYTYATGAATGNPSAQMLPSDDPNECGPILARITDENGRIVDMNVTGRGELLDYTYNQTFDPVTGYRASSQKTSMRKTKMSPNAPITTYARPTLYQTTTMFYAKNNPSDVNENIEKLLSRSVYTYNTLGQRQSVVRSTGDTTYRNIGSGNGYIPGVIFPYPGATNRTETYGYDELSRLTSVNYGDAGTANVQTYDFDVMGNRTAKTDNVTGNETYSFDAANRLTSRSVGSASGTYTNDANGNTLSGGGRTNIWDSQNRLVKVVKNGITSEFTYGCDGLRRRSIVTKSNGEQTQTDYVVDGDNVVQEVVRQRASATASWGTPSTISYLQGPQGPLYRRVNGTTDVTWYVYDGLGSIVGEVDVTGNLTATKDHDVYGLTRGVTGSPTSRHGFVGQLGHTEDDETGYLYMRARHYDPETGRFVSQDPARHGRNWFVYASNDPTNKVDRSGKIDELPPVPEVFYERPDLAAMEIARMERFAEEFWEGQAKMIEAGGLPVAALPRTIAWITEKVLEGFKGLLGGAGTDSGGVDDTVEQLAEQNVKNLTNIKTAGAGGAQVDEEAHEVGE